jgi:hypothetical protein
MIHFSRYLAIALVFFSISVSAQFSFDSIFQKNPLLKKISSKPDRYRLQIIYTKVDYEGNKPVFSDYFFNVKPENYFYCASLIKLPTSILSLEKLKEIGLKRDMIMFTDSTIVCHRKVKVDPTSGNQYPTIENYIKRMLLVSDNESFSRTYEFLGVDYIHEKLKEKGYPGIRITNRYDGNCKGRDNLVTNPVTFYDKELKPVYRQEEARSETIYSAPVKQTKVGTAYLTQDNKKIKGPKDFSGSNYMSLIDSHNILRELIYDKEKSFKLSDEERKFLTEQMSYYPRQSASPQYDPKTYYDSYKKYLIYGDSKKQITDTNIIITNIVGQSYGFLSDCAHIRDKQNNIEFILSAVIYANEDEFIDSKYDYQTIGLPYLAELGRQFYSYELRRKNTQGKK